MARSLKLRCYKYSGFDEPSRPELWLLHPLISPYIPCRQGRRFPHALGPRHLGLSITNPFQNSPLARAGEGLEVGLGSRAGFEGLSQIGRYLQRFHAVQFCRASVLLSLLDFCQPRRAHQVGAQQLFYALFVVFAPGAAVFCGAQTTAWGAPRAARTWGGWIRWVRRAWFGAVVLGLSWRSNRPGSPASVPPNHRAVGRVRACVGKRRKGRFCCPMHAGCSRR